MDLSPEICAYAAELNGSDKPYMEAVSRAVWQILKANLRKNVAIEEYRDALITAGALLVLRYMECIERNELASFDAGTLKLAFRDSDSGLMSFVRLLLAPCCRGDCIVLGV
ncbi:MAG: hypothetical protein E7467_03285 [Ruminococcaceae bacterium]|nr:hypothetical protein [Oscillospiraceae bacterium]